MEFCIKIIGYIRTFSGLGNFPTATKKCVRSAAKNRVGRVTRKIQLFFLPKYIAPSPLPQPLYKGGNGEVGVGEGEFDHCDSFTTGVVFVFQNEFNYI